MPNKAEIKRNIPDIIPGLISMQTIIFYDVSIIPDAAAIDRAVTRRSAADVATP